MDRRDFLRRSAATAAGLALPYYVPAHVLGSTTRPAANDRLKVAFIGCGGRARHLMINEGLNKHADIVAVADCFLPQIDEARKLLPNAGKVNAYQDYRKLLEKEKLDAVFIPTTTHARVSIAMEAMAAGLDVYAEKPVALTVTEGRALARAVAYYKRVFQAGTQQRSIPINAWASQRIRRGLIGRVKEVHCCNFTGPRVWDDTDLKEEMPAGLDWDLWCNQTPLRPYQKILHRGWQLFRAYDGGGQSWGVTGWGTHALDQVQCALGTDDTGPVEIWSEPAKPEPMVTMRYANGTLLKLDGKQRGLEDLGAIFVGEKGTFEIRRGSCVAEHEEWLKDAPADTPLGPGEAADHLDNFFECMRTRNKPRADVETAQRATTLCILVNLCRELNRKLHWDPQKERFTGDDEANRLLARQRRTGYELPGRFMA